MSVVHHVATVIVTVQSLLLLTALVALVLVTVSALRHGDAITGGCAGGLIGVVSRSLNTAIHQVRDDTTPMQTPLCGPPVNTWLRLGRRKPSRSPSGRRRRRG
jgi:hypothetical protein